MSKGNSWKDKNRVAKASSDNKTYRAYEYFIQKGLTPAQASGIVGNLVQESGLQLDTQVEGFDKTGSYGIAQWLGNRKTNLIKFAEKAGKTHSDFSTQLDFVWHELNTTEKKAFNKLQTAKSPEEAALAISKYYERPSEKYAHNEKRINYANQFYSQFGNEAIPSSSNINPQEGVSIDYSTPMVSVPEGNSQEAFLAEYNKLLEKQKEDEIRQSQKVQEIDYKTKLQQKINERNFLASYVEGTDVEYVERTKNEEFYLQDGGKIKPKKTILVESPSDPRYRAYQDSLNLHAESVKDYSYLKKLDSSGEAIDFLESRFKKGEPRQSGRYPMSTKAEKAREALTKLNKKAPTPSYAKIDYELFLGLPGSSISTPIYKKPNQRVEVIEKKPTPTYKDSLELYNKGLRRKSELTDTRTYPFDTEDDLSITDKNAEAYKDFKRTGIMPDREFVGLNKNGKVEFRYGYKKPIGQQKEQVEQPKKEEPLPRVKTLEQMGISLNIRNQEKPLLASNNIDTTPMAEIPISYDIEYKGQRMNGEGGYYNKNNQKGVDVETAIRAKEAADKQNQYWIAKYGNSTNPKAIERLNTLKDEVKVTPNYKDKKEVDVSKFLKYLEENPDFFNKMENGGIPVSERGMYDFPKQEVIVPTSGNITMKGIKYPILGKSLETGETQMMFPEQDYFFEDTKSVLEVPVLEDGGVDKQTYISNKIRTLMKEGKPQAQAIAIAISMWENR